jgi:hypothetical protein
LLFARTNPYLLELAESSSDKSQHQKEYDDMQFQFQELQEQLAGMSTEPDVCEVIQLIFNVMYE